MALFSDTGNQSLCIKHQRIAMGPRNRRTRSGFSRFFTSRHALVLVATLFLFTVAYMNHYRAHTVKPAEEPVFRKHLDDVAQEPRERKAEAGVVKAASSPGGGKGSRAGGKKEDGSRAQSIETGAQISVGQGEGGGGGGSEWVEESESSSTSSSDSRNAGAAAADPLAEDEDSLDGLSFESAADPEEEEEGEHDEAEVEVAVTTPGGKGGGKVAVGKGKPALAPMVACRAILPKHLLGNSGGIELAGKLPVQRTSFIFRYDDQWRYSHMAMLEHIRGPSLAEEGVLIAAWQAAPAVEPDAFGRQVMAVEGLQGQRILFSLSYNLGKTWTPAKITPTHSETESAAKKNPFPHSVWSPVVHADPTTGRVYLFYSESNSCWRPTQPPTWEPGGDIRLLTVDNLGLRGATPVWSKPRTLLREDEDGVPRVIANKLVVMSNGEWALPYWREQPRYERIAGFPSFKSACHAQPEKEGGSKGPSGTATNSSDAGNHGTSSGVLISGDKGLTWTPHGNLTDPRTDLIEGTLAVMDGQEEEVVMLLRTNTGCSFQAKSVDKGRTWSHAVPVALPNPNSKIHMVKLYPSGYLAVAFNNHHRSSACKNCRTHLHVVVSRDGGITWRNVATLEDSMESNVRIHYPTLLQVGSMLYVAYSRFYLGRCRVKGPGVGQPGELCSGLSSPDQGVKLAEVDLTHLETLPQMRLPPDTERGVPTKRALYGMLHHFVATEVPRNMEAMGSREAALGILLKLRQMKWKDIASILALIYDLDFAGGAKFLRSKKGMGEMFKTVLNSHTPALKERYTSLHGGGQVEKALNNLGVKGGISGAEGAAGVTSKAPARDEGTARGEMPNVLQGNLELLTHANQTGTVAPFIAVRPMGYSQRRRLRSLLMLGSSNYLKYIG